MTNFNFNDVIGALSHIKGGIPARRLSARVRLADHKSVFFGPSYDFYDIQEYDPERDEPNQIIPGLTGPNGEIFARKCIEQHEMKVIFLVDLSSSIDAGLNLAKRKMLLESFGYLGITGVRYQDPIGFVGFTDRIVLNQPARCGVNNFYHLLRIVYDFLSEKDSNNKTIHKKETDFFTALDFVRKSFDKPCFIPVISDFVGFEKVAGSSLLRAVIAKHEMVFIFLDDPLEFLAAEGIGQIRMEDIEDGSQFVVSRKKLPQIEKEIRFQRKKMRKDLRRMGIDSVVLEYGKQGRHFNRLNRFFLKRYKQPNFGR
jgi:uncharacterized protein (DUF58 family)